MSNPEYNISLTGSPLPCWPGRSVFVPVCSPPSCRSEDPEQVAGGAALPQWHQHRQVQGAQHQRRLCCILAPALYVTLSNFKSCRLECQIWRIWKVLLSLYWKAVILAIIIFYTLAPAFLLWPWGRISKVLWGRIFKVLKWSKYIYSLDLPTLCR